jgi:hypothetical protein
MLSVHNFLHSHLFRNLCSVFFSPPKDCKCTFVGLTGIQQCALGRCRCLLEHSSSQSTPCPYDVGECFAVTALSSLFFFLVTEGPIFNTPIP